MSLIYGYSLQKQANLNEINGNIQNSIDFHKKALQEFIKYKNSNKTIKQSINVLIRSEEGF